MPPLLDLVVDARPAAIAHGFDGRRILPYRSRPMVALEPRTLMPPLGERFIRGNFVSSHRERIDQAKADWQAGRIALPPNDNAGFVPGPLAHRRRLFHIN